jgi:DNA/RNA endonuclease YhcR with UshA esterase domain
MKICFSVFAGLAFGLTVSSAQTNSPAPQKIGALEATQFYGREMIVTGEVAQVSIRPGIVFLNLDQPYPKSPFSLVIFPSATNQFGDLESLKGQSIEARGKIINYHNKPEIVLKKAEQLNVTGTNSAFIK